MNEEANPSIGLAFLCAKRIKNQLKFLLGVLGWSILEEGISLGGQQPRWT